MPRPVYLPLGPAPLPSTGEDLLARVRDLLLTATDAGVADAIAAGSSAEVEGTDVVTWTTDATGVVVPREALDAADRTPAGTGAVTGRDRGVVRDLVVHADPMTVAGAAVRLDVRLAGIPFDWVTTTGDGVGVDPVEPDADHPVTGTVDLSVAKQELLAAVREVATEQAAAAGVSLGQLEVDVHGVDARTVRVDIRAQVRRGILGARVTGGATAGVDGDLVLRVRDLELSSPNPIVGAMVAVARSRVEAAVGRPRSLARYLPPGVRVSALSVEVGDDVVVHVGLG